MRGGGRIGGAGVIGSVGVWCSMRLCMPCKNWQECRFMTGLNDGLSSWAWMQGLG